MAELKRSLGFWTVLSISISSIMGTGLFFGAGIGSGYSGNASILAWIILSVVAVYISMYFAELSSMFPRAGGIYEFSRHAYNRFMSFMMGWTAWIVGNLSNSILIVAAIDYLIPQDYGPWTKWAKIAICICLILLLNLIAYFGIEASAFLLIIFAAVSVGVLSIFIIPGAFEIQAKNFSPFFALGFSSIFITMFFLIESFFGWESATYLAEETHEPEKIIPKSIVIGTVIVGVLGVLVSLVSLGIVSWKDLSASQTPLSLVSEKLFGDIGTRIVSIGIFITLIGSAAGGIITMPRLILALARDKLFIAQLSSVHERFKTPYKAIIFQTVVSLLIFSMVFGKYKKLLSLLLPLSLLMYFFVVMSVPILRRKEPNIKRSFKVPFARIGSFALMAFIIILVGSWIYSEGSALGTFKLGLSLIFVGVPIYALLEVYYNPEVTIKLHDSLANLTLLTENILLPKNIRNYALTLLGDIKGKKILEFGCSVGTLTIQLAEAVKPDGIVYATDLSSKDLAITKQRLIKKGYRNVYILHDEHQINRVHPSIPHVDAIASIGMMGYLQDVKKVLREMRDLVPYGAKVVFVDYADFFKVIPNVAWLSDNRQIEKIFREAGFSVFVTRKKGLFWNYVYVYGIKFHEDIPYI